MHCWSQCPRSWSRPPPTHTSPRQSWTHTSKSGSILCLVTAFFPCVLVCTRSLCPQSPCLQSCVSSGSSVMKLMATFSQKAYAYAGLLHPEPLPLWQAIVDPYLHRRHSKTVLLQSLWGLWLLWHMRFVWALHGLWRVWSLFLNVILPFQPSCWEFSFAFEHGLSFFGRNQHSPFDSCLAMSCNFGVLKGEDELIPFYSTILLPPLENIFLETHNSKRHTYHNVHFSTVYNSQDMRAN